MSEAGPRVVIVGGGFGGIAAAKALTNAPTQIIVIDRTNHHVFQPLGSAKANTPAAIIPEQPKPELQPTH